MDDILKSSGHLLATHGERTTTTLLLIEDRSGFNWFSSARDRAADCEDHLREFRRRWRFEGRLNNFGQV